MDRYEIQVSLAEAQEIEDFDTGITQSESVTESESDNSERPEAIVASCGWDHVRSGSRHAVKRQL